MTSTTPSNTTVSVVFAANDYYVPYLSTLFASILDHCNSARTYEFMILSEDFEERHVAMLEEQLAPYENVSLRMLDVTSAMQPYENKLVVHGHFKRETYFRLLLPQLLPDYHKVLYLDADMICLRDVAELFDTELGNNLVAACKDPDTTGMYNGITIDVGQPDKRNYMDTVLKLKNPFDYFQAGTIVFNLDAWRESIDVDEVFRFAQSYELQLLDQDALNAFCQGRVAFLDMAWNVMYNLGGWRIRDIISHTTPELYEAYMAARKEPYIVHYAGPTKPWHDPECDFAEQFWRYAARTPFYAITLRRTTDGVVREEFDRISELVVDTRAWIQAVDDELKRYENRSFGLMVKELIYQKMFTPLVNKLTANNEGAKDKIYEAYRKVHPSEQ